MIDIVIVNYNTRADLQRCLASLPSDALRHTIVVDNASTDGSDALVATCFPQVTLLVRPSNDGYAAGANAGIRWTTAPYVLLLNSDTQLAPDTLTTLVQYLARHPRAAVVGPRLINSDGSLQRSCFPFPTPVQTLLQLGNVYRLVAVLPFLRERTLRTWSHDRARPVPWVLGAVLAIRRDAFEHINGFDESFFMYSEEVDLCYRMQQAAWQTHFAPVTTVTHARRASTRQQKAAMEIIRSQSTDRFYRKHFPSYRPWERRIMATAMRAKIWRDTLRLRCSADYDERQRLLENLAVWRGTLARLEAKDTTNE